MKKNKVSSLKKARARQAEKFANRDDPPWQFERWFEVTEMFDPNQIVPVKIKEVEGTRMFFMGLINDIGILQVPAEIAPAMAQAAVLALSKKGIRSMAFADTVRFMRLRMCSPEEETMLTEADVDKQHLIKVKYPTPEEATASLESVDLDECEPEEEPESDSTEELPSEKFEREKREADESNENPKH